MAVPPVYTGSPIPPPPEYPEQSYLRSLRVDDTLSSTLRWNDIFRTSPVMAMTPESFTFLQILPMVQHLQHFSRYYTAL